MSGERRKIHFLGLDFDNCDMAEAVGRIEELISAGQPAKMFSLSAELIVTAAKDDSLRNIYETSDLLTLDGYIPYYAARITGLPAKEPVSASRLMFAVLASAQKRGYRVYLLGGSEEVVAKTARNILEKYPGINIAGAHHGYFDFKYDSDIINDIRSTRPDVIFVAMSSPMKERFVAANIGKIGPAVCLGVGGAFDVVAGKTKLAPRWVSRAGLEWLYRLVQEPRRLWKRYLATNTIFLAMLAAECFRGWFRRKSVKP